MLMQDGSLRSSECFIDSTLLKPVTSLIDGHRVASNLPEFLDKKFLEKEQEV